MIYLNTKSNGITYTIDELNEKDFSTYKLFNAERKRLREEYTMCQSNYVYWSNRSTKDWRTR